MSQADSWGNSTRQWKQQIQRPWSSSVFGMFGNQQGGVWVEWGGSGRGGWRTHEGDHAGSWRPSSGLQLLLYPGWEATEDCEKWKCTKPKKPSHQTQPSGKTEPISEEKHVQSHWKRIVVERRSLPLDLGTELWTRADSKESCPTHIAYKRLHVCRKLSDMTFQSIPRWQVYSRVALGNFSIWEEDLLVKKRMTWTSPLSLYIIINEHLGRGYLLFRSYRYKNIEVMHRLAMLLGKNFRKLIYKPQDIFCTWYKQSGSLQTFSGKTERVVREAFAKLRTWVTGWKNSREEEGWEQKQNVPCRASSRQSGDLELEEGEKGGARLYRGLITGKKSLGFIWKVTGSSNHWGNLKRASTIFF